MNLRNLKSSHHWIKQKTLVKELSFFALTLLSVIFIFASNIIANPKLKEEGTICIYPKSVRQQPKSRCNLFVPSSFGEDVEFLAINQGKKQFTLIRAGKEPVELERAFQPTLPWDLPRDQFEQYVLAHTLTLKAFSDGGYKIDFSVPGLGGGRHGAEKHYHKALKYDRKAQKHQSGHKFEKYQQKAQKHHGKLQKASFKSDNANNLFERLNQQVTVPLFPCASVKVEAPKQGSMGVRAQPAVPLKAIPAAKTPAQPAPNPKGVNHPSTKKALDYGNKKHREFEKQTKHLHKGRIIDEDGKIHRPDLNREKVVFELKPLTPSGVKKGQQQLQRYQDASGKKGFFLGYNPNPGRPIKIDEIARRNFPRDPVVQRLNADWLNRPIKGFWDNPFRK